MHVSIASCFTIKWNLTVKVCYNFAFAVTAMSLYCNVDTHVTVVTR